MPGLPDTDLAALVGAGVRRAAARSTPSEPGA